MNLVSVPCLGMALVNFYVGSYYLYLYSKQRQMREHLPFALLCLGVGLYDVFCAGLYNAGSLAEGLRWQKLQLDMIAVISVSLIWFTSVFTHQESNRLVRAAIVWLGLLFLVALVLGPELTLSLAHPAIKHILLLNQVAVTYYEAAVGPIYQVEIFSGLVIYLFLFYLFIRHAQRTQHKILPFIVAAFIIYFLGVVNDTLVALQVYQFIYVSEYTFFVIILVMAYLLLDRFVAVHIAYEELNANLELKIAERTREIQALNAHLKSLADHDGLTGVYNRRFFNGLFEVEVQRATSFLEHQAQLLADQERGLNFGLAMIDIDHFKQINDTCGHLAGDAVLKAVVAFVQNNIFARDVLCRYGGDEFALLLTKTARGGILQAVERIRREIEAHEFSAGPEPECRHITISVGLVIFDEVIHQPAEEILKLADDRLLRAKRAGRNRIVCEDES
jgi:diguanylate cyclase (GGDEF)-like protein